MACKRWASAMAVLMMQVRIVRVAVTERVVRVPMAVRFSHRIAWHMRVQVMRVLAVPVLMRQRLVDMIVRMTLGEM